MNTNVVIANPQISCDHFPALTVPAARTPRQQYSDGWMAFCRLEPIGLLTTDAERKGYMAALNVCADIETDMYLAERATMSGLRLLAVGRICDGEIITVSEQDVAAGHIVYDPAYVPDWQAFLEHAAKVEASEVQPVKPRLLTDAEAQAHNEDYAGDIEDRARHSRGQW